MTRYAITQLWVEGMRSLDQVELDLTGGLAGLGEPAVPTVLIGPNGAGKSTIIEACEILRKAAVERPFVGKLYDAHGGPPALVRRGAKRFGLGVELRSADGDALAYIVVLRVGVAGMTLTVEYEEAIAQERDQPARSLLYRIRGYHDHPSWAAPPDRRDASLRSLVERSRQSIERPGGAVGKPVAQDELALTAVAHDTSALTDLQMALASIEVHTAIDARAAWTTSAGMVSVADPGARSSNVIRPVTRVELNGRNLPNVYHALRNQNDWPQTLERIRLTLGDQIEDVVTPADPSGGRIGLALRVAGVGEIPAYAISDGQLSYLVLLGVLRLQRPSPPALVVFDEPDLHLHPSLARRLIADLETFARSTTVLVATQSDAMLDALAAPARSSVLCELDDHYATQLVRPDPESLARWLEDYRGLGELRAAGYENVVFPTLVSP